MSMEEKERKPLLTYKEVARLLGCHQRTVENIVKAGSLKAYKFGSGGRKMVRFKSEDVARLVEKGGE